MPDLPSISWLGAPPPPQLAETLGQFCTVREGWTPGCRVVGLMADAPPSSLRALPAGAERPPVLVVCSDAPSRLMRRLWEDAGADQVVDARDVATTLLEWLEGPRQAARGDDPPTFNPLSQGEPLDEYEPSLAVLSGPVVVDEADPFPALRLGDMPAAGDPVIQRFVRSVERYLERRDEVVRRLGEDGLTRFLELAHLREQVPASLGGRQRLDPYGRGRNERPPDWKVLVRRMKPRTREIEVSEGRLYAVGTDGVVLVTLFAAAPRQRLLVDLPLDEELNAQFIFEARWQRRIAAQRWHVGALMIEMRHRPLKG